MQEVGDWAYHLFRQKLTSTKCLLSFFLAIPACSAQWGAGRNLFSELFPLETVIN